MGLPVAILPNGEPVNASSGEKIRHLKKRCPYCGKPVHLQKMPLQDEYYFAHDPGQHNENEYCRFFEGTNYGYVFDGLTPEKLIELLSRFRVFKVGPNEGGGGVKPPSPPQIKIMRKISNLDQFDRAGIYAQKPFAKSEEGGEFRNIDYVIYTFWADYIWKQQLLVAIGPRIVDCILLTSMNILEKSKVKVKNELIYAYRLWLSLNYKVGEKKFLHVRFCLSIVDGTIRQKVVEKIFRGGENDNGTWEDCIPRYVNHYVLAGGCWQGLDKNSCHEICPLYSKGMCSDCIGAYGAVCNSPDQIQIFDKPQVESKEKYGKKS